MYPAEYCRHAEHPDRGARCGGAQIHLQRVVDILWQTPAAHHEDTPADFLNFYALSKAAGEQYCLMFDRLFGLSVIVLRYFNVYGPRQPQTGAYALVLGIFLRRKLENQPLEIHGSGGQRRDFVHVRDVADANIAAFECAPRKDL